jgi:hypothetical protein
MKHLTDTIRDALKLGGAATNAEIKQALTALAQLEAMVGEPVAWVHEDDPHRVISAATKVGAEKDGGAIASTTKPYSIPAFAAPVAQQPQAEARPCHAFNVTKNGALIEWEPTTMVFALPDGKHALYTAPQQAEAVPQWQPIETAPRKEAFLAVLSCGGEQQICTMRWPVAEAKNARPDSATHHVERVTHWMPLPAAPQPKE